MLQRPSELHVRLKNHVQRLHRKHAAESDYLKRDMRNGGAAVELHTAV